MLEHNLQTWDVQHWVTSSSVEYFWHSGFDTVFMPHKTPAIDSYIYLLV
jgi:hypothetical protein